MTESTAIQPKERPILFSGEMIVAILEGRKTQTRRIIKHPEYMGCLTGDCQHKKQIDCTTAITIWAATGSPYGTEMDHLWVRETFKINPFNQIVYRADEPTNRAAKCDHAFGPWKPAIFMPRKASRITLEITCVRVEKLDTISEEDAEAEGVEHDGIVGYYCEEPTHESEGIHRCNWRYGYKMLWESINGKGSWDRNDWVFVIEFKRIKS
jgi:hypothetical protein